MITLREKFSLVTVATLKQGLVLFAATSAVSVLNYLFQVMQSRLLGPRDYATLAAVLSLFLTVAAPTGAAQALLADYVARFRAVGELGKASRLSRSALLWLGLASVPAAVAVALLAGPLAAFLRLDSGLPILALATVLLTTLLNPALIGILQGLERFQLLSVVLLVSAVVRLASGAVLVWLGWGASGGILASAVAGASGIGAGLFAIRHMLRQAGEAHRLTALDLGRYGGSVMVTGLLFSTFLNLDMILVKHYFEPEMAGHYAAASTVGKMVFFVPGAVGTLMFPRISAQMAAGGDGAAILRKGALATLGLCGALVALLILFPAPITRALFGAAYGPTARLIGGYGLVMLLFALVNLLMLYHLSAHEARFAYVLGAGLLLQMGALALFHASLSQVIALVGASVAGVILVSELWLPGLLRLPKP